MNWSVLGMQLADAVRDAGLASLGPEEAYGFLLEHPQIFGHESWPDDMPQKPNIELIVAYYAEREARWRQN